MGRLAALDDVTERGADSTRERILRASAELFAERGYRGTTMRAIADAAGVNLAAANYHFGSKQRLLAATLRRHVDPINAARASWLNELEANPAAMNLVAVLRAFVEPALQGTANGPLPQLVARLYGEPKTLSKPLLERAFGVTAERFIVALKSVLPELDEATLRWRFHFAVGAMVHQLNFSEPMPGAQSADEPSADERSRRLVAFMAAGLCGGSGGEI